jgi:hypothetical protein
MAYWFGKAHPPGETGPPGRLLASHRSMQEPSRGGRVARRGRRVARSNLTRVLAGQEFLVGDFGEMPKRHA